MASDRYSKARRWARILMAAVLIGAFGYLGRHYYGKLHLLLKPNPFLVVGSAAVFLVTRVLNGEVMRAALRRLGRRIGLWESFLLTMLMSYTNLLVPHAGLSAPALYLKQRYGVRYSDFGALLMPLTVLQFIATGAAGLAVSLVLGARGQWLMYGPLAVLFACLAIFGTAVIFVRLPVPRHWQGRIARFLRRLNDAWAVLRASKGLVLYVLGVHVGAIMLRGVRLQLAFAAVGHGGRFPEIFLASLCAQLMLLISLTPGALGFREAAVVEVYRRLVGNPEVAMTAALLDRIIMVVAIIGVAQLGLWQLVRPVLARGEQVAPGPSADPRGQQASDDPPGA